jgi:hypothetical protein
VGKYLHENTNVDLNMGFFSKSLFILITAAAVSTPERKKFVLGPPKVKPDQRPQKSNRVHSSTPIHFSSITVQDNMQAL